MSWKEIFGDNILQKITYSGEGAVCIHVTVKRRTGSISQRKKLIDKTRLGTEDEQPH